jgi:ABC-type multidrug transport system fused ATPase/permease subunit
MKVYNKYLIRAKDFARKQLFKTCLGVAMLYLVLNCFYAYTFFFGGYLRYNKVLAAEGVEYTGGRIVAIMFCVVISCFRLGSIGDHMKAIIEGRVAAKMTWNVIDTVPSVQQNETGTQKVERGTLKGRIEF